MPPPWVQTKSVAPVDKILGADKVPAVKIQANKINDLPPVPIQTHKHNFKVQVATHFVFPELIIPFDNDKRYLQ